jgi:two-component system, chemotaxis family, chemotaxis protein CheY
MNVLIVDDSAMTRVILKRNLISVGVREEQIFEAENGEQGLARFETFHCRAVITDWRMPVMDGLTFVKELRKRDSEVPIIMLTAANERGDVVAAIESGVTDYLIKPFAAADMRKKLLTMLARMQANKAQLCAT